MMHLDWLEIRRVFAMCKRASAWKICSLAPLSGKRTLFSWVWLPKQIKIPSSPNIRRFWHSSDYAKKSNEKSLTLKTQIKVLPPFVLQPFFLSYLDLSKIM